MQWLKVRHVLGKVCPIPDEPWPRLRRGRLAAPCFSFSFGCDFFHGIKWPDNPGSATRRRGCNDGNWCPCGSTAPAWLRCSTWSGIIYFLETSGSVSTTASPLTERPSLVVPMKYHFILPPRRTSPPLQLLLSLTSFPSINFAPGQEYQSAKSPEVNGLPVKLANTHLSLFQTKDPNSLTTTEPFVEVTEVS